MRLWEPSINLGTGKFYISSGDGEMLEFNPYISDAECKFTLDDSAYDDFEPLINPKDILGECTISFTLDYIDRRKWLSFYHGRKVTNNWLKMMPGGIMCRKTRRKGLRLSK